VPGNKDEVLKTQSSILCLKSVLHSYQSLPPALVLVQWGRGRGATEHRDTRWPYKDVTTQHLPFYLFRSTLNQKYI
jgi:hypothetical protein